MHMSGRAIRVSTIEIAAICAITVVTLAAQTRREYHYNVGPRAVVSINNPYGSISVKPSTGNTVSVSALLHSDKVEVDNGQTGNHVDIQSHLLAGADAESGRVDYEIMVPADASVSLHSSTGPLRSERLHGDVTLDQIKGPLIHVISTSGRNNYSGDFGNSGEYRLTSHSGDIEATVLER